MPSHRRLFLIAAGFNLLAGMALLFYRAWFDWLGVWPNPDNSLFVVLFAGAVLILGYAYYLAAIDFEANRPLVKIGAIAKLLVFAVAWAYFFAGMASWHLPAITVADLVFALLFIAALRTPGKQTGAG